MNCPNCSSSLRSIKYENVNGHTCDKCGGEFVGPSELRTIVKTREVVFGKCLQQLMTDHEPMFGNPAGEDDRHMACPGCQGSMQMINYSGDTGIAIDRCEGCGGVWLDHEELEKVQLVMEKWQDDAPAKLLKIAGKLEETRRKTAEKTSQTFAGSRFSFVNALINRLLDAA